ncbi:YceI family protein [Erythrobacter sp. JK5]|uniref:YceI family protein n=1 Tax=Erythrobacter sp. JK5 TaxID=2829500 RepID=UPI001BA55587|nr:YceI family protein [Erythrobacter sp. JK5]QUL38103.1 YceI family protein [Erythrobacter sp. JK5]
MPLLKRKFLLPIVALVAPAVLLANSTAPLTYTLDASASNVSAKVPFFGLSSKTATFPKMEGTVRIVPGQPERALIDVTFDATAIKAPDSVTLERLRGEKFFWVEKYPQVRFVGRSLKLTSPTRGTVSGELTARGVTQPQVLDVTFDTDPLTTARGKPVSFTGTTTIDRRKYGMKSYQLIVGNKVDIRLRARMLPR